MLYWHADRSCPRADCFPNSKFCLRLTGTRKSTLNSFPCTERCWDQRAPSSKFSLSHSAHCTRSCNLLCSGLRNSATCCKLCWLGQGSRKSSNLGKSLTYSCRLSCTLRRFPSAEGSATLRWRRCRSFALRGWKSSRSRRHTVRKDYPCCSPFWHFAWRAFLINAYLSLTSPRLRSYFDLTLFANRCRCDQICFQTPAPL